MEHMFVDNSNTFPCIAWHGLTASQACLVSHGARRALRARHKAHSARRRTPAHHGAQRATHGTQRTTHGAHTPFTAASVLSFLLGDKVLAHTHLSPHK